MLAMGLGPLGIPLQARRVGHLQLFGEVVDDLDRHTVQRISQEPAQIAHRRQLDTEPQAVVITPVARHQGPVLVVQEEEPLQLDPRRHTAVPAEGRGLLITEKVHRHGHEP